jgi:hypothetical protein
MPAGGVAVCLHFLLPLTERRTERFPANRLLDFGATCEYAPSVRTLRLLCTNCNEAFRDYRRDFDA